MELRRRSLPVLAVIVAAALGLAACGSSTPTPTASVPGTASPTTPGPLTSASPGAPGSQTPDPATVYAQIEAQVQQIRELSAKTPVAPKLLDEATLKTNLAASFEKDNPPKLVAANERTYQLLGLIPDGTSLKELYLKLLGSQVAGYYDSDTKELSVVSRSGVLGPTERITFAHEFDHALQDQLFGLDKLELDAVGESDRSLARLSVAEGDATLLMLLWAGQHLTPAELLQVLQAGNDPEQTAILAEMPDILKDSLLFPYTAGQALVASIHAAGGWAAVDEIYADPPTSTEQVLHPAKYAAREQPVKVEFPKDLAARLGSGWSVDLQDTMGEFELETWLTSAGKVPQAKATSAAEGWGGDRLALVSKGTRSGLVVDTRWDSPADAAEFAVAARSTLDAVGGHGNLIAIDGSNRVTVFLASDDATISALAGVLGLAG
ncbi:MAG: hypothetical protein M3P84_09030 [Chloroflexota bacterium]|nr:hypothetical protein [Chloroflexota bacterium]